MQPALKLAAAALLAGLLVPAPSWAQTANCTVSATALSAGSYNPLSGAPVDGSGSVTVNCQLLTGLTLTENYTLTLSAGGSGQYSPRRMTSGSFTLNYNLYRDALRLQVWGDGTGGSFTVQDSVLLQPLVPSSRNYPVYARIPSGQNVAPGSYLDTILVTLNF